MPKIKAVKTAGHLDMSEAERMARMREAGMERGLWRGGSSPRTRGDEPQLSESGLVVIEQSLHTRE